LPFSGFILVMEILLIAFTLFNSIGFILFFISLINFRKRMNFVGMAGIIGLISVFGLTILFIFFLFFTSVFLRVNILFIILAAIFYIGGLITLLLLSYALKHASMKFEI